MTVSNSTDFSVTGADIVTNARRLLGIQPSEEELQAHELDEGLFFLNAMLKAWQADGVMVWSLTEGTFTLTPGTVSYVFGAGGAFTTVPLDIEQIRVNRNSVDLEMTRMSRSDYYTMPNKTNAGFPIQYFYDRQRDNGTLYVWPAPDTVSTSINFTYRRRIMDIDSGTDTSDLPQEWIKAMIYGLANELIPIYGKAGTPRAAKIEQGFSGAYISIKGFDNGEGMASVRITPNVFNRSR